VVATVPQTATMSAEATRELLKELLCSLRVDNRFLVGCRVTYTDISSSPTPSAEWHAEGVRLVLPRGCQTTCCCPAHTATIRTKWSASP